MNSEKAVGSITFIIGLPIFVFGVFMTIDAWTIMYQVQASGVIGQVLAQEQYQRAVLNLKVYGAVSAFGFGMLLLGSASDISGTFKEIAES
ncbi:hypothetical protein ACKVMT_04290 [Halobacteriales archaeon Cl-PHB]